MIKPVTILIARGMTLEIVGCITYTLGSGEGRGSLHIHIFPDSSRGGRLAGRQAGKAPSSTDV